MAEGVTLALLAGGASSRFGADKALTDAAGEPLLRRVARRLLDVPGAVELVVACGPPERAAPYLAALAGLPLPARAAPDARPGLGPAAGLAAALATARGAWACAAPCDAPLADPRAYAPLLEAARGRDGALWRDAGGLQPLHAVWRPAAHAAFARAAEGGGGPRDALRELDVAVVDAAGVDPRHFAGADTPGALARLLDSA